MLQGSQGGVRVGLRRESMLRVRDLWRNDLVRIDRALQRCLQNARDNIGNGILSGQCAPELSGAGFRQIVDDFRNLSNRSHGA